VEDQTRPVGGRVLWRNEMKIEITIDGKTFTPSQDSLLTLLKVTAEIMDSGDIYPYFYGDYDKKDLEGAKNLSLQLREVIDPLLA